jgi:magnesium chelatase subunit D
VKDAFPFSSVVGQDEARLALLLAAVDPAIGGVLLRGEKGSAKSTLARGLAGLLPDGAPFVELPVGATEDRVLGSLDLRAALADGGVDRFRPGLLAAAHGGVLYVDEVNLLPDHLVDSLLDAAASGVNRVERDGISHEHPARFVLLGSMNPEEGELRPQLLDRFGLSVSVHTPRDPVLRAEAVRRRLAHDAGAGSRDATSAGDEELRWRLASSRPADLSDDVVAFASRLAVGVGAESLRADLVLCRAAAALAGWEGRQETTTDDVVQVAGLALGHRRRRRPFDPPTLDPADLESAVDEASAPPPPPSSSSSSPSESSSPSNGAGGGDAEPPVPWQDLAADALQQLTSPLDLGDTPRRTLVEGHGRAIGDRPLGADGPQGVAVLATARAALRRRLEAPDGPDLAVEDLRSPRRAERQPRTIVLCLDASGSMGTRERVTSATGAVLGLLADAYLQRDQVALVAFRDGSATEVLPPTGSVELARARLADLPTGGPTPLAEGITAGLACAQRAAAKGAKPLLVLLTDARATGSPDALTRASEAAAAVAAAGIEALVLDAEPSGPTSLGLATTLAEAMSARYLHLTTLTAPHLEATLRQTL